MKILHVVTLYFQIPYFVGDQLVHFNEKGNEMHVICSPSDEIEKASKQKLFKYSEIPITRKISPISDLKSVYAIFKYIKKNKIDIVTGHSPKGSLLGMIASFIAKRPKRIYVRHGLVFETATGLKKTILRTMDKLTALLATKVICVSPSIYKKSLEYGLNKESKQVILSKGTCNGIDLDRFDKVNFSEEQINRLKDKNKIDKENIVIGFVGRLVRDKGVIELVDAFEMLQRKYNNITLLLVGMYEDRDALPAETKLKIEKNRNIVYTDYVQSSEIQNYYSMMNIFVLPSYREGFPVSVLEASSMSIPIIVSKVTGCIDAIEENVTGLFVQNTATSIQLALDKLIENEKLRKFLGGNARKFMENNFDQKVIWDEIEKIYNS